MPCVVKEAEDPLEPGSSTPALTLALGRRLGMAFFSSSRAFARTVNERVSCCRGMIQKLSFRYDEASRQNNSESICPKSTSYFMQGLLLQLQFACLRQSPGSKVWNGCAAAARVSRVQLAELLGAC